MNYSKINLAVFSSLFIVSSSFALEESNFLGDGNEGVTINSYMAFPEIASSNLEYRLGQKRIFKISYGNQIDKTTFSAVLNDKDISRRFHPVEGESEHVYLPLRKGANTLRLKISDKGDESNGVVPNWDIDEFSITLKGLEVIPRYLEPPKGFEKGEMPPARTGKDKRPVTIDKSKK